MAVNLSTLTPEQQALLKKNNPTLYGASAPAPTPAPAPAPTQSLGSKDVSQISQKDLIDAFAKAGNTKALEAQKNNYVLPSPTQNKTLNGTTTTLPTPERKSSLVDFASALDAATTLARSQRHASELGILEGAGFTPGQVRPSDMAHILNLLDTRSSTRTETLQTAAMDAYQAEEKQKQTDIENKQKLALSLLTSGQLDSAGVAAVLNSGSSEDAMRVAASVIKTKSPELDIRQIGSQLVSVDANGQVQVLYTAPKTSDGSAGDYAPTSDGGYEKSGSGNPVPTNDIAPRTQQVIDGFTTISSLTPTEQAKVRDELYGMGFGSSTPPAWFEDYYNATTGFQANLNSTVPINSPTGPSTKDLLGLPTIEQAWNTYRNKILGSGQSKSSSQKSGGLGDYSSY